MAQGSAINSPFQTRLLPLEPAAHLTAALLLAAQFWGQLDDLYLQVFVLAIVAASGMRLLILGGAALRRAGAGADWSSDFALNLATALSGLAWGASVVLLPLLAPDAGLSAPLLPVITAGVTAVTFAGSALASSLLLAFAVPAMGIPLGWAAWLADTRQLAVWGFLLLGVLVLASAGRKLEQILARVHQMARGNAELMKNLAAARDQAVAHQRDMEQANALIRAEIEEREKAEQKIKASEQELNRILEDMMDTYFQVDREGRILRISPSIRDLLGYDNAELEGEPWASLFHDEDDAGSLRAELEARFGIVHTFEARLRHREGHEVWVSINAHYRHDADGALDGFEGLARDITERRRAREALFQEKELLRVTLESIADGVITTDMEARVQYVNPVAEAVSGWSTELARGEPLPTVMHLVDEDQAEPVALPIDRWLRDGEVVALDEPAMLVTRDRNHEAAIELKGAPIRDSEQSIIGAVLAFHDVTKLRALAKQLSYQATHDALTGLINRVEFDNRVTQAIHSANQGEKRHALFYIDLDQFKVVNDTCGHHAGDELLKQVTSLLRNHLRQSDSLARLGGDEFGVLLNGCPLDKAEEIAEKLRAAVEAFRFPWDNQVFRIGTSIGVVPITSDTPDITRLLSQADAACYVAKEQGRNRVHVSRPDDQAVAEHHGQMQWMQRIQEALDDDQFTLYCQPIVDIRSEERSEQHWELLLRMQTDTDDDATLIPPNAFIPAAERYHLMPKIDRWVLRRALTALAEEGNARFAGGTCTINLSGQSISDLQLYDYINALFRETGVDPACICFEITESAVIANIELAQEFIRKLRRLGCRFALDDFGSGLSSFEYLKNLPVDYVKLDGSLVKEVATHRVNQAMVHAINYVAHVMDMKSIAEYAENEAIIAALRKIDVDYAQGYAVGRPVRFC